jgi:hypothetical protein
VYVEAEKGCGKSKTLLEEEDFAGRWMVGSIFIPDLLLSK